MFKRGQPLTVFDEDTRVFMAKSMLRELLRRELAQKINLSTNRPELFSVNEVNALHAAMPERQVDETIDQWLERGIRALQKQPK
jgi:hypothetical protein